MNWPHVGFIFATSALLVGCTRRDFVRADLEPAAEFRNIQTSALAEAAQSGDIGEIEQLVAAGADIRAKGKSGAPILQFALNDYRKRAFRRLLELGADPNTVTNRGSTIIRVCAMIRDSDYLELALKHGGDPNGHDPQLNAPVIFQTLGHDLDANRRLLLKAGANIKARTGSGATTAAYAAGQGRLDLALEFLEQGVDPSLRDSLGRDIAAELFRDNRNKESKPLRDKIVLLLERRGWQFDATAIARANIFNLAEACGKEPPRWLKGATGELNPEWIKKFPVEAEKWYQAVHKRSAPKY